MELSEIKNMKLIKMLQTVCWKHPLTSYKIILKICIQNQNLHHYLNSISLLVNDKSALEQQKDDHNYLDDPISIDEVETTIKLLKSGKAPVVTEYEMKCSKPALLTYRGVLKVCNLQTF